ncbi:MAG TPA: hypothetical protein VM242_05815 [Acidimicrobiales bacterium]|nr:hypothetical protein [Acidimicrobiales bacterium]
METERAPRFWELARRVAAEGRRLGLASPGFRTPPVLPGARRTLRRTSTGAVVAVAVASRGRPPSAVLADLVDGLVLANGLAGDEAAACRRSLLAGLSPSLPGPGAPAPAESAA